ncbi:hypothetical protein FHS85_004685 [Rhodoligotrophos appendicifer]|uniref:hypothetical protein n=1 Tax=Rhodoligotrophos appendicifer TaxID=987056 RepID=UPI001184DCF2|nr:hypothetical protein [Rhodoligotrophos appendicifer]
MFQIGDKVRLVSTSYVLLPPDDFEIIGRRPDAQSLERSFVLRSLKDGSIRVAEESSLVISSDEDPVPKKLLSKVRSDGRSHGAQGYGPEYLARKHRLPTAVARHLIDELGPDREALNEAAAKLQSDNQKQAVSSQCESREGVFPMKLG